MCVCDLEFLYLYFRCFQTKSNRSQSTTSTQIYRADLKPLREGVTAQLEISAGVDMAYRQPLTASLTNIQFSSTDFNLTVP